MLDQGAGLALVIGHPLIEFIIEPVDVAGDIEAPRLAVARLVSE